MQNRQLTKSARFLQNYTRTALTREQRLQVLARQETDRAINIFLQGDYAEIEARIIAHHLRYGKKLKPEIERNQNES